MNRVEVVANKKKTETNTHATYGRYFVSSSE